MPPPPRISSERRPYGVAATRMSATCSPTRRQILLFRSFAVASATVAVSAAAAGSFGSVPRLLLPVVSSFAPPWPSSSGTSCHGPAAVVTEVSPPIGGGRRGSRSRPRPRFPRSSGRRSSSLSSSTLASSLDVSAEADADVKGDDVGAGAVGDAILAATQTLTEYDENQRRFVVSDGSRGLGGGMSALSYIQTQLSSDDRSNLRSAARTLTSLAHIERASDSSKGRIMVGFCASNVPEALGGLKSWVSSLELPRGMLHGMDVDGVPVPVEDLGTVYVKYSTGGAMTFSDMRRGGRGFDSLWRPGDALLESYDGDFRGVYLTVELSDGDFRQFGVLPTDLFMEEEEW